MFSTVDKKSWPPRLPREAYTNARNQYTQLTQDVFEHEFPGGKSWYKTAHQRNHTDIDLSGEQWCLDTLEGEELGILHPGLRRDLMQSLNVSNNRLTSIDCLNVRENRHFAFRNLTRLNAARNMLTDVRLLLDTLTQLNLAHNELRNIPNLGNLVNLQRLVLSHNRIDGPLRSDEGGGTGLQGLLKLFSLDLSHNEFSWRPSSFKTQLDVLKSMPSLTDLNLEPNPFALRFKEYQFIAVAQLEGLEMIDGKVLDRYVKAEIRKRANQMDGPIDFGIFDTMVKDRDAEVLATHGGEREVVQVPQLSELINVLEMAMDMPDQVVMHIEEFDKKVASMWNSHIWDRQRLMPQRGDLGAHGASSERMCFAYFRGNCNNPHCIHGHGNIEEWQEDVAKFGDKLGQVLQRFDSVQKMLVMCLVRMLSCGNSLLANRCAELLADWVEAVSPDLHDRVGEMSEALFGDLRERLLAGVQSVNDRPELCLEVGKEVQTKSEKERLDWMRENQERWPIDANAESACILESLGRFVMATSHVKSYSPFRSQVLRPLLVALCRDSHEDLGREKPKGTWSDYAGFATMLDDSVDRMVCATTAVQACKERCIKHGWGGFVTCELDDQQGMMSVHFKDMSPISLSGLRKRMRNEEHARTVLWTRPVKEDRLLNSLEPSNIGSDAWRGWLSGLAILVAATFHSHSAAHCVELYKLHERVVELEATCPVFEDKFVEDNVEARLAFTQLMQLAVNLTRAHGDKGLIAKVFFKTKRLHRNCWKRAQRYWEWTPPAHRGGHADKYDERPLVLSSLFSVVCCMGESGDDVAFESTENRQREVQVKEVSDDVMADLKASGMDLFYLMVDVSVQPRPDPLLLASSLELIFTFLNSDVTMNFVVQRTMGTMMHGKLLLPYVRGRKNKDEFNIKYAELWRQCELLYPLDVSVKERMPELVATGRNDQHKWLEKVPELARLTNPLMHRVLINIVRLFDLFSRAWQKDGSGSLRKANDDLDEAGREDMLIGPSTGLVTCPDYDVKLQCLRCIRNIVVKSVEQFQLNEMGTLMRYLTAEAMGVGQQENFLMLVLEIIIRLVEDTSSTGQLFRDRFAKNAIRESFEMLQVNARRDVSGSPDEEESKLKLSLTICGLLQACSVRPGVAIRRFMRRGDLLQALIDTVKIEDAGDRPSYRQRLLRTWTGRQVPDVLLPLATHDHLDKWRVGRYLIYTRTADILAGKRDYRVGRRKARRVAEVETTNERYDWPSLFSLRGQVLAGLASDPVEDEDWTKQQKAFVGANGCQKLVTTMEAFCGGVGYKARFSHASEVVGNMIGDASSDIDKWWGIFHEVKDSDREIEKSEAAAVSQLEMDIATLLTGINERVMRIFGYNLRMVDDHTRTDTIAEMSHIFARELQNNKTTAKEHRDRDPTKFEELRQQADKLLVNGKLQDTEKIGDEDLANTKIRQPRNDLRWIVDCADKAHRALKKQVVAQTEAFKDKDTEKWAQSILDASTGSSGSKVKRGLAKIFRDNHAEVMDVVIPREELVKTRSYKYRGDWSRLRNLSRLVIEYPSAGDLLKCLQDIENSTLSVKKIRNRFKNPTSLGQRYVLVYAEVRWEGCDDGYLCELKMVLKDGTENNESRLNTMKGNLEKILGSKCQVATSKTEAVADYLIYVLSSRSVRQGDAVRLMSTGAEGRYVEVSGAEVLAQEACQKRENLLTLERVKGLGVIESGDVVSIKSLRTERYLDVAGNWVVRCRNTNPDVQEQGRTRFVVEVEGRKRGRGLGLLGGTEASQPTAPEGQNIHAHSAVRFRVKGTKRYLSVVPQQGGLRRWALKGQEPGQGPGQVSVQSIEFVVHPHGSLHRHLSLDDEDAAGASAVGKANPDVQKEQLLAEVHMCAKPPVPSANVGGQFRKASPEWNTIAWRQAKGKSGFGGTGDDFNADECDEKGRLGMLLAACLRCAYVVIELPREDTAREKVVKDLLVSYPAEEGIVDHVRSRLAARLLVLAMAAQVPSGEEEQEPDVTGAWLSAKLLRLFSAVLAYAPSTCDGQLRGPGTQEYTDKHEQAEEDARQSSGIYDRQRLLLLCVLVKYVGRVLKAPLQRRLKTVPNRDLDMAEVVLLYEFVKLINNIVVSFLEIELRWAPPPHSAGTPRDSGLAASGRKTGSLSRQERMQIFTAMIPSTTLKLLVHVLLFGMHQEAVFFQRQIHETGQGEYARPPEEDDGRYRMSPYPRRLSALIDRCIDSVAAIMYCTDGQSGLVDCDYHVCTAISQAMSTGTQVVPRARISQLMHERATDKLRNQVQQKIDDGELQRLLGEDGQPPGALQTERVCVIGLAWTSVLDRELGDSQQLSRRLVVITSRMTLVVLALPPFTGGAVGLPDASGLEVVSCRSLRPLQAIEVWRRMRQCLVLHWSAQEGAKAYKEVLIFESSGRRRAFQRLLRRLPSHRGTIGVAQMRIRELVKMAVDRATVSDAHKPSPTVDIFFVRDYAAGEGADQEPMTFGDAFTERYGAQPKAFVLNLAAATSITMRSFLQALAVADHNDPDGVLTDAEDGVLDDTDSEDDALPTPYDVSRVIESDGPERIERDDDSRLSQHPLKKLDGVWFLAEAEPKVRLQFGTQNVMLSFMSDGERQRFRRRLAHLLLAGQQAGDKDEDAAKGWSVLPTVETDMKKVKKAVAVDPRAHLLQADRRS